MSTFSKPILLALSSLSVTTGCATVPKEAGFSEVRTAVAERTGVQVPWNRLTADDHAVADALGALTAEGLTADRAVQVALLNNRNLQATYQELGVAQAEVVQAGLLGNPVFDGEVKFLEAGEGHIFEIAVVQDFLDVFFIPLRKRVARNAFEAAKLRVTGAVLDLVGEVRSAFYTHAAPSRYWNSGGPS